MDGAAEELVHRLPGELAADVPQSHVDGAHGVDHGAASAVHGASDVHSSPQFVGFARILSDQDLLQGTAHGVCAGRTQTCLGDPWIHVGLADAGHARVRVDHDEEAVLRRRRQRRIAIGSQQNVSADLSDAHLWAAVHDATGSRSPRPNRATAS